MLPFPLKFETSNFEKYKGKGDLRNHIKELFTTCIEVANEDTYLMCLFSESLDGRALEWFSHLPHRSQGELVQQFITNFSHNIDNPMTLIDLCATKQKEVESFSFSLQCWCSLSQRCPYHILKKEQVDIFTKNLVPQIKYPLQMQCLKLFDQVIEKGLKCKKGLIEQGILKNNKDNNSTSNTSNERTKFWSRNKNITNDNVVDAHMLIRAQPIISLQGPINPFMINKTYSNNNNANAF